MIVKIVQIVKCNGCENELPENVWLVDILDDGRIQLTELTQEQAKSREKDRHFCVECALGVVKKAMGAA